MFEALTLAELQELYNKLFSCWSSLPAEDYPAAWEHEVGNIMDDVWVEMGRKGR